LSTAPPVRAYAPALRPNGKSGFGAKRLTAHHHDNHDLRGFQEIYDGHFKRIFNYILARVGNVAEAEDLTAQTFMNARQARARKAMPSAAFGPRR